MFRHYALSPYALTCAHLIQESRRVLAAELAKAPRDPRSCRGAYATVLPGKGSSKRFFCSQTLPMIYIYIYICIYRERDLSLSIYIYICIHILLLTSMELLRCPALVRETRGGPRGVRRGARQPGAKMIIMVIIIMIIMILEVVIIIVIIMLLTTTTTTNNNNNNNDNNDDNNDNNDNDNDRCCAASRRRGRRRRGCRDAPGCLTLRYIVGTRLATTTSRSMMHRNP